MLSLNFNALVSKKDDEEPVNTTSQDRSWTPPKRNGGRRDSNRRPSTLTTVRLGQTGFKLTIDKPYHGKLNNPNDKKEEKKEQKSSAVKEDIKFVEDFNTEFADNKTNSEALCSILNKGVMQVANIIATKYFDNRYESGVAVFNRTLKIMTTKLFATNLLTCVKTGVFEEDWEETKADLAALISLALDTSSNSMKDETIGIYVEIVSEHIWQNEIKEMCNLIGLDEESAIDTAIAIPYFGKTMTELELKQYVPKFWAVIQEHAEELIDTMDAENQKKLFYFLFPQRDNRQLQKAIGKCLTYELVEQPDDKSKALYEQYQEALYLMLNELDIEDIEYVLKFVNKEVARRKGLHNDAPIIYDELKAADYDDVRKAMANVK